MNEEKFAWQIFQINLFQLENANVLFADVSSQIKVLSKKLVAHLGISEAFSTLNKILL